jgi:hypothetical protein
VVVTGYANLIVEGTFGPLAPGISASVQKMIKQGNHVSMFIANLLETAQLDAMQGGRASGSSMCTISWTKWSRLFPL